MKRKRTKSQVQRPGSTVAPGASSSGRSRQAQPGLIRARSAWTFAVIAALVVGLVWLAVSGWQHGKPKPASAERPTSIVQSSAPTPGLSQLPSLITPANPPASAPPDVSQQAAPSGQGRFVDAINRANQLLAQQKPGEALDLLLEAEKLNPEDEDVHYNLGIALSRLGRNGEAAKEYREALRIFPDYAEAQNNLANLLLRTGEREEALKLFQQAVTTAPDYAAAWNNYGNALQQSGQTNQARDCFEKASKLDTNYWQAHFNLGTSYLQQKRFPEARSEFETVLRLQPGFAQAQTALQRIDQEAPLGPVRAE